jgi:hypothetical protein
LDDLQIRVIKAALLGNTLKIRFTTKLYDPLSRWLVSKVDTVNCKLVLGSKKKPVVIDLYEAAAKVIGVRNDPEQGGGSRKAAIYISSSSL